MKKKIDLSHEIKSMIFNGVFGILNLAALIIFFKNPLLLAVILFALTLIALFKWKSRNTLIVFFCGAIWGTICELIAVYLGIWSYAFPSFLGIPYWLFFGWGNISIFLYRLSNEIRKIKMKLK